MMNKTKTKLDARKTFEDKIKSDLTAGNYNVVECELLKDDDEIVENISIGIED